MSTMSRDEAVSHSGREPVADLEVVGDEPDLLVAVAGLPRIYSYGLLAALASDGMRGVVPASDDEWRAVLDDPRPLVVVVAQAQAAAIGPLLATSSTPVPVVHVVGELTAQGCAQALGAGATGVLLLDADLSDVVGVVRAAADGEVLLPPQVATGLCGTAGAPVPELRPHEAVWLRRLADAWTVSSLARQAHCSEREMYRQLNALYARLGATNRTEALLRAQRCGLLDDVPS